MELREKLGKAMDTGQDRVLEAAAIDGGGAKAIDSSVWRGGVPESDFDSRAVAKLAFELMTDHNGSFSI